MTYASVWMAEAVAGLARAPDPAAADREAAWMDTMLRRDPRSMGESRSGADRVWYGDVIGIYFRVDDAAMTVRVLLAGPARRR
ncbi:MAG: hypothetical protein K2X82_12770 [Gemmataceae bacterium]|nr:hypothetical protein [Gemmataceae bacterium]